VPAIKNVKKKFAGKGFELVGISSDDDEDVWRTFVEAKQMDWHEYIDLSGDVLQAFNIDSFPTYVVVDKDGVIRYRQSGYGDTTEGELEDAISKALKRNSDPALANAAATPDVAEEETKPEPAPVTRTSDDAKDAATGSGSAERPFGIEAGTVAENVYTNDALSLRYEFPKAWIAAKAESLHEINVKAEAAAKASMLRQHPEMAEHLNVMMPVTVFYASKRGEGNPQRLSLPCIRINATPARMSQLSLETFQRMADNMAVASSAKLMGPANKYEVKEHNFLRVDMERNVGGTRLYQAYVQTASEDYLLTIEIYATSAEELQNVGETLQTMVVKDE